MAKVSTFNRLIDEIIAELFEVAGELRADEVELLVMERFPDEVSAEGARLAALGLKSNVASRLRALSKDPSAYAEPKEQLELDLPDDLSALVGRIITVDDGLGGVCHRSINHPTTTLGDLKSHRSICARHVETCTIRLGGLDDIIDRAGDKPDEMPLVEIFGTKPRI